MTRFSFVGKSVGLLLGALALVVVAGIAMLVWPRGAEVAAAPRSISDQTSAKPEFSEEVSVSLDQQKEIGIKTVKVSYGPASDVLEAPGQITPDESRFAYITPRSAGIVRSVAANIGQEVRAGDLLATIDSTEVAQARLDLIGRLQDLVIAESQSEWQEAIHRTTMELLERIKSGDSPEDLHKRFENRPVGENRETLITAYAQYRLAKVTLARNKELHDQNAVSLSQYQQAQAEYEAALATFQGLMDRTGYESTLAYNRARQSKRQAEIAVRVARERLLVLGVKPDGTEPLISGGKVVGVRPDGTLPAGIPSRTPEQEPEAILPRADQTTVPVKPVGAPETDSQTTPVSTYAIWAPFDGTILDREMLVPGVAVDVSHRIFTLANLATVWVEVHVPEGDFAKLAASRRSTVELRSPAYPDRTFTGEVLYTGDLVDPKSLSVKLLARAQNPDRLLKPGMFVDVTIHCQGSRDAVLVPTTSLLTEEDDSFVYVRVGPDRFQARHVITGPTDGPVTAVFEGLEPDAEVVSEGAFILKGIARNGGELIAAVEP